MKQDATVDEVLALRSEVEQQRKQWEDVRQRNVDLLAEIQRLQDALNTCRELRKFDTAEIKRLRALLVERRQQHDRSHDSDSWRYFKGPGGQS